MVWNKSKLTSKGWEEVLWHLVEFYESYNILSRAKSRQVASLADFHYKESMEIGVTLAFSIWQ